MTGQGKEFHFKLWQCIIYSTICTYFCHQSRSAFKFSDPDAVSIVQGISHHQQPCSGTVYVH